MADDDPAAGDQGQADETDARLNRLEAEQVKQGGMLETILAKVSGAAPPAPKGAQQATDAELDKEGVVEEVIAELGRRKDQETEAAEQQTIAERVAALEERPPKDPLRKVTRLMFGAE
jgi:hypothetical protein